MFINFGQNLKFIWFKKKMALENWSNYKKAQFIMKLLRKVEIFIINILVKSWCSFYLYTKKFSRKIYFGVYFEILNIAKWHKFCNFNNFWEFLNGFKTELHMSQRISWTFFHLKSKSRWKLAIDQKSTQIRLLSSLW